MKPNRCSAQAAQPVQHHQIEGHERHRAPKRASSHQAGACGLARRIGAGVSRCTGSPGHCPAPYPFQQSERPRSPRCRSPRSTRPDPRHCVRARCRQPSRPTARKPSSTASRRVRISVVRSRRSCIRLWPTPAGIATARDIDERFAVSASQGSQDREDDGKEENPLGGPVQEFQLRAHDSTMIHTACFRKAPDSTEIEQLH